MRKQGRRTPSHSSEHLVRTIEDISNISYLDSLWIANPMPDGFLILKKKKKKNRLESIYLEKQLKKKLS